jgi:hypothetical protein
MGRVNPAGWYADPNDLRFGRYWDGTAWTEHVTLMAPGQSLPALWGAAPPQLLAPPAPAGGSTPDSPASRSGRPVLIALLVGLVVAAGIVVAVVVLAKNSSGDKSTTSSTTTASNGQPTGQSGGQSNGQPGGQSNGPSGPAGDYGQLATCETESVTFETAGMAAKVAGQVDPSASIGEFLQNDGHGQYWTAEPGANGAVQFVPTPGRKIPAGCVAPADIPANG